MRLPAKALTLFLLPIVVVPIHSQEPAVYQGLQAVRFDEGFDRYHYVLPCNMPSAAVTTPPHASNSSTEPGLCWPAVAGLFRILPDGKLDGTPFVAGVLFISAHNVRFFPDSAKDQSISFSIPVDKLIASNGLPKNQVIIYSNNRNSFFRLFLRTACLQCVPNGLDGNLDVTPQIAAEISLVADATLHFDAVLKKISEIAKLRRVNVFPGNQPTLTDPHEAMALYSDLNRKLIPLCPVAARSCVQSYADYQACSAASPAASCGTPPSCSTFCPLSDKEITSMDTPSCTSRTQDGMTLYPDWTDVARKMEEARLAHPIDQKKLKFTQVPAGTQPTDFMGKPVQEGCGVESGYSTAMLGYMTRNLGTMSAPAMVPTTALPNGHVRVPAASMMSLAIDHANPIYPPIAGAAHVEGTVVLSAVISTTGIVTDLHVVSGPEMLKTAAIEAVSRWTFKPFLALGQPMTVETEFNIIFSFNSPAPALQKPPVPNNE